MAPPGLEFPPRPKINPSKTPVPHHHTPPTGSVDPDENQRCEDLRRLSAEMLDLQDVLSKVISGDTSLAVFADYITDTVTNVDAMINELEGFGIKLQSSDMLQHILNAWQQMKSFPLMKAPDGTYDAQQQLHDLSLINVQIDKMVYLCGYLTIPARLTEWLDETRPGYYIPFHEVFQDEVPNANDRARLLKYLAWSPVEIKNGYIDLNAGLVYKYSRRRLDRWMSIVYLVLAFLITTGIVVGSCFASFPNWPLKPENLGIMLSGWLVLLVGVAVHIGIGNIKDTRKKGLPTLFAPEDIFFIINARLSQIVFKLFIALIGLFGLVLTNGLAQFSILSSFLLGYSLDSFVEMFGSSLSQQSASQLNALQQQLGVAQE